MTHETPAQRRTRLIEQYAGQIYAKGTDYIDDAKLKASKLADAVIAATPQELEAWQASEQELDELREHINDLEILLADARANLEIERHRKKQAARYPNEMETRLIDLCEDAICECSGENTSPRELRERLAAIKRDLGLV